MSSPNESPKKRGRPRLPRDQASVRLLYRKCRYDAERRGIYFALTIEEYEAIIALDCYYCGIKPKLKPISPVKADYYANGVDRKDNTSGYFVFNCVPACPRCNYGKHTMGLSEFYDWNSQVYHHRISKGIV